MPRIVNKSFSSDVDSEWILELESEDHFLTYWQQARLIYDTCSASERIAEVGVGSSLLADMLRRRGWSIFTVDIDEKKSPDLCSDMRAAAYSANEIEAIAAFEVFEHVPFYHFADSVSYFHQENIKKIIFSLPRCESIFFSASLKLPRLRKFQLALSRNLKIISTKNHYWELGLSDRTLPGGKEIISFRTLEKTLSDSGFSLAHVGKLSQIQFFVAERAGRSA